MILKIIKRDTIFEGMFFLAMKNMLKDNDLSEKSNVVSTGFWTGPGLDLGVESRNPSQVSVSLSRGGGENWGLSETRALKKRRLQRGWSRKLHGFSTQRTGLCTPSQETMLSTNAWLPRPREQGRDTAGQAGMRALGALMASEHSRYAVQAPESQDLRIRTKLK